MQDISVMESSFDRSVARQKVGAVSQTLYDTWNASYKMVTMLILTHVRL